MNKLILSITGLFLMMNILIGLILSFYPWFNIVLSSIVIASIGAVAIWTNMSKLASGFKASLMILVPILGMAEFVLSLFSPQAVVDNWVAIALIIMITFQLSFLLILNFVSKEI